MIYDGFLWFLTSFDQYWQILGWFLNFWYFRLEKSHFAEKIYFRTLSPEVTLPENVSYG